MSWHVDCLEEVRDRFDFDTSVPFQLHVTDYILAKLENESCTKLAVKLVSAPVRGCNWFFNLKDERGQHWRFRVFFNDTAKPGIRTIYDFSSRKIFPTG